MKKLIYSTLGLIIAGSLILGGCKKDGNNSNNNNTTPPPATPKPVITFITTASYTFVSGTVANALPTSALKFGVIVNSTIDLKTVEVKRSYQGGAAKTIYTKTLASGLATFTVDVFDTLPANYKGAYVYTFNSTDKDGGLGTTQITITATGPLFEIQGEQVWSAKGTLYDAAYDMANNTNTSANGGDKTIMDILDLSTSSVIAKSWGVGAGCTSMFIKGPFTKQYSQIKTEADVKALWDANVSNAKNTLTGMVGGVGMMVLIKVSRTATPTYYVMTIDDIVDGAGPDNDYTLFSYKY